MHGYQQDCLDALAEFFAKTEEHQSLRKAFAVMPQTKGDYVFTPEMKSTPSVCIRVPTGGGKTLIATHAMGVAAEHFGREYPVCLWLVPSDAIFSQTLKALQSPEHPCRKALNKRFPKGVNCIPLSEALQISKGGLVEKATVIVSTVQALRREETEGLKVYQDNDALATHFEDAPAEARAILKKHPDGDIVHSLANALHLCEPIVILDEAHKASTKLSHETLAWFNPSCIVEFSATPAQQSEKGIYSSNVLCWASARALHAAEMIKLPVNLETHGNWKASIAASLEKLGELETAAEVEEKKTKERIRPIVLYQAENENREATVAEVRAFLKGELGLGEEEAKKKIAICTSDKNELQGVNLLDGNCQIQHIITKQKLAEGWDCSFAYILCTLANLQSGRPVEQVLGRILRMPRARRKKTAALNESYAFATAQSFMDAAESLADALVNGAGIGKWDAPTLIVDSERQTPLFNSEESASKGLPKKTPPISVPMLAVRERESGNLEFLEAEHFLDAQWSIADKTPEIEFSPGSLNVARAKAQVNEKDKVEFTSLETLREWRRLWKEDKKWELDSLASWLTYETRSRDIPTVQSAPFVLAAVRRLAEEFDIPRLGAERFRLKASIIAAINAIRREKQKKGYQAALDSREVADGELTVSPECALVLGGNYAPSEYYEHSGLFCRHLFPLVADMNKEEAKCADFLDTMPEVEVWVRNLVKGRNNSFWLQTSYDKFYPDFVCRLRDKRILVVEYKGKDAWIEEDATEKRNLGKIWAELGGDNCLFVMPQGKDWSAIEKCVRKKKA